MKSYKRMVASLLAMLMLVGVLPLADLRADEAEETDAEVVIEETSEEEPEESDVVIDDEIIFEEPAEVEAFFEEISEEVVEVEETEEVEELVEEPLELPAEEIVVEPEEDLATGVEGFINRIYSFALGRTPDAGGHTYWINQINRGKTGADVARYFLFSPEFINKNMTNSQFLDVIYRVFFDRDADASGKQFYLNKLASGWTKQQVINAFIDSTEWANICQRYGIASGSRATPTLIRDFVTRLYTSCLNRSADPSGLSYYANLLTNHTMTGTQAAQRFFFSQEMIDSNISNDEFIRRLYRTCFGREADTSGFSYWSNKMNVDGWFREDVFNSFVTSAEWKRICEDSGIAVGSPIAVHHAPGATWANVDAEWYRPTDRRNHYVNRVNIEMRINNNSSFDYFYRVYRNGRLIYTSRTESGDYCRIVLDTNIDPDINRYNAARYIVYYYAVDGTCVYSDWCEREHYINTRIDESGDFCRILGLYNHYWTSGDQNREKFTVNSSDDGIRYYIRTDNFDNGVTPDSWTLYYRLYYFETADELEDKRYLSKSDDNLIGTGSVTPLIGVDPAGPGSSVWNNRFYYYQIYLVDLYQPGYYEIYVFDHDNASSRREYMIDAAVYVSDN